MQLIISLLHRIDDFTDLVGRIISLLVIAMCVIILYEVVARYIFNNPTIWAHELTTFIFGGLILLGGSYTLRHRAHVNLDLLYRRLPLRPRAILDVCSHLFFFFFCGVLMWKGWEMAASSLVAGEHTMSKWAPPLFPVKVAIPLGAFLMLLQGLSKYIKDFLTAVTGKEIT